MPLPISKRALDKLGAELAAVTEIDDAKLARLAEVLEAYQVVLEVVKAELAGLGYRAHSRLKTTTTLIEKLRRETRMGLSRVQDIAGARITVRDRVAQDEARDAIIKRFEAKGCRCKPVDRRLVPSCGYRAVHVIVRVDGLPVEIQIRTELQNTWAQIMERLGDQWGRDIRYGGEPAEPDRIVVTGNVRLTRREAVQRLLELSETIDSTEAVVPAMYELGSQLEKLRVQAEDLSASSEPGSDNLADLAERLAAIEDGQRRLALLHLEREEQLRAILQGVATARDEEG